MTFNYLFRTLEKRGNRIYQGTPEGLVIGFPSLFGIGHLGKKK